MTNTLKEKEDMLLAEDIVNQKYPWFKIYTLNDAIIKAKELNKINYAWYGKKF